MTGENPKAIGSPMYLILSCVVLQLYRHDDPLPRFPGGTPHCLVQYVSQRETRSSPLAKKPTSSCSCSNKTGVVEEPHLPVWRSWKRCALCLVFFFSWQTHTRACSEFTVGVFFFTVALIRDINNHYMKLKLPPYLVVTVIYHIS